MKQIFLFLTLLCNMSLNAQTWTDPVNGLIYESNGENATVSNGSNCKGNVEIKAQIELEGKTYNVTSIGAYAFYENSSVASVTIPEGVKTIGEAAFWMCTNLTKVSIPCSVTDIESSAFAMCILLTSITIPEGVKTINEGAFYFCFSLSEIIIPNSVTNIGYHAFEDCENLKSVAIPSSITTIGNSVFAGCTSLTEIAIPNSVTIIGYHAFEGCQSLKSVAIPSSVTYISEEAFKDCSSLTSLTVDGDNKKYDSRNNCNAIIETETNELIVGCKNTIIPNDIVYIGPSAFYGCTGLTEIIIPEGVIGLDNSAFSGCSNLKSITIPSSIAGIMGWYTFKDCSNLQTVIMRTKNPYGFNSITWEGIPSGDDKPNLIIPVGTKEIYKVEGWAEGFNIIEDDNTGIINAGNSKKRRNAVNLMGVPVDRNHNGIIIMNGKKILKRN